MNLWMIIAAGVAAWWFWPKLSGSSSSTSTATNWRSLDDVAGLVSLNTNTASAAFCAMETVRNRMLEVGASAEEIEQLTTLAPVLLRKQVPQATET